MKLDYRVVTDGLLFPEGPIAMADGSVLVVEIKGFRGEDVKDKHSTMDTYWIPGVNNLGSHGRWAFVEFTDVYEIQANFEAELDRHIQELVAGSNGATADVPATTSST